jgi:hypothetical protein
MHKKGEETHVLCFWQAFTPQKLAVKKKKREPQQQALMLFS